MTENKELAAIRDQIDKLDEQIQALITERARCALKVGKIKHAAGDTNFYRPEREARILKKIQARNEGVIKDADIMRLFREIISVCLSLEQPLRIAFLGPEGTYSQAAALKQFGHAVRGLPVDAIDEVFREVESGSADYGVVPIENSTEGVVNQTLDMFLRTPLSICGEVELRIHHQLMSREQNVSKISKLFSHQQTFAQCREWLNLNMSGIEHVSVSSNADAARLAAQTSGSGAVAGETAAELYGLNILASNIEDEPGNTTRFLVVGKQTPQPSGSDKTSLLISSKNKPGSLYALLEPLSKHGVSMTRIESRPSRRGMWDYVFFVDVEGHQQDQAIAAALAEIEASALNLKILGSYPRALLK